MAKLRGGEQRSGEKRSGDGPSGLMRWGIIGLGRAGRARAGALRADPRATLIAAHGGDPSAAELPSLPLVELLEQVQAVAICSPDALHPQHVTQALDAGCHVLCEFPLAPSQAQAQALLAHAERAARVLHVEHIELLEPAGLALQALLAGRAPTSASMRFTAPPAKLQSQSAAHANIARLHRAVAALGFPLSLRVASRSATDLDAALRYPWGELGLSFHRAPELPRSTQFVLVVDGQVLTMHGRTLRLDGRPAAVPTAPSLFLQDQLVASARILDGAPHYLDAPRLLRVLGLADLLATSTLHAEVLCC